MGAKFQLPTADAEADGSMQPEMSSEQTRRLLASLPFMDDLPKAVAQRFAEILIDSTERTTVVEGTQLFTEGEHEPDFGYVLLSGQVQVEKSYTSDSMTTAPALLGEIKQFNPTSERTATVRASGDLDVLQFRWDELNAAINATLKEPEQKILRKALLDYAWKHVLN